MMSLPQPGWAWLINHGEKVAFGGVSVADGGAHPWLAGGTMAHTLVAGSWVLIPEVAVTTEQFSGFRIDQLMTMGPDSRDVRLLTSNGGVVLDV